MYRPSRNNQNTIGDVGAAACNGRAACGKETGEVVPPARSAPGRDEAGIIYTISRRRGSIVSRGPSPPPEGGVEGLENVFTAPVRSRGLDPGGTDLTEQLTTGALLLVTGAVLTIIGIVFFPFLCVGIPLLVVGLILIVAEGGRFTKPPVPLYPGYGPSPPYAPYATLPPPAGPPKPSSATVVSPGPPPIRYCVKCG